VLEREIGSGHRLQTGVSGRADRIANGCIGNRADYKRVPGGADRIAIRCIGQRGPDYKRVYRQRGPDLQSGSQLLGGWAVITVRL
jgi:hypothetical protein